MKLCRTIKQKNWAQDWNFQCASATPRARRSCRVIGSPEPRSRRLADFKNKSHCEGTNPYNTALLKRFAAVVRDLTCGARLAAFSRLGQSVGRDERGPPVAFAKDEAGIEHNVAWKTAIPGRGVSSPILVAGKVIVTAASGFKQDRLHVLCIDAKTGPIDWERQFWATGRTLCHPTSSVAANTPSSDGKRIFAFFSSNDLACLDLDGNLLWYRGLTHDFPRRPTTSACPPRPWCSGIR